MESAGVVNVGAIHSIRPIPIEAETETEPFDTIHSVLSSYANTARHTYTHLRYFVFLSSVVLWLIVSDGFLSFLRYWRFFG